VLHVHPGDAVVIDFGQLGSEFGCNLDILSLVAKLVFYYGKDLTEFRIRIHSPGIKSTTNYRGKMEQGCMLCRCL
jgi:hypothetical protein